MTDRLKISDLPAKSPIENDDYVVLFDSTTNRTKKALVSDFSSGSGTPGGNNTNIQFNDNGSFNGENDFSWDTSVKSLKIGSPTLLSNNPVAVASDVTGYSQINMQNTDAGNSSSGDIVITADNGSDTANYVDLGINSSTYNQAEYSITSANDAYLLASDGNLAIGTGGDGKDVVFHTSGTTSSEERLRITDAGLELPVDSTILVGSKDIVYHNHQAGIEGEPEIIEGGTTYTEGYTLISGWSYKIVTRTTLDFTLYGAADNNVNTVFTATGTGVLGSGDSVTLQQLGDIYVAQGNAWFFTDSTREELTFKAITSNGWLSPVDDTTSYVCADRDTGYWTLITTLSSVDYNRYIPYFIVYKRTGSNSLHTQIVEITAHGEVENAHSKMLHTNRYERETGTFESISVDTSRNITMSGGGVWAANYRYTIPDVTTATRQFEMLNTGGTWTLNPSSHTTPVINNTQWNNTSSGYATLTDTYWNITYIYRGVEDQDHIYTVLSTQEYATSTLAQADNSVPVLPEIITSHAVFVGRVIAQKNATTGFIVESAFTTVFAAASAVTDHGSLSGLGDDDHTQYAKKIESVDIEITDTASGVILKSANGTRYRLTISNDGELNTTAL